MISSEKASNNPGFCSVKGQKLSLGTQTNSQNQFLSLSLGVTKTPFGYHSSPSQLHPRTTTTITAAAAVTIRPKRQVLIKLNINDIVNT
jgi:hypothetical protein